MSHSELFKKLVADREDNAKVLGKASMRGVRASVVEKYTEQAHFIYELLQNADDVKATKVEFLLDSEGLIFIHNGTVKFNVTDSISEEEDRKSGTLGHINAITSIGNSSKVEQQIGKFGIGFKAVFQYTESPFVYEDDFKFGIERFIVPKKLENDHPKRKEGETLFYFPFNNENMPKKKAYKEISERIENLGNPLLFINNLKEIHWSTNEVEDGFYIKDTKQEEGGNNIQVQHASIRKSGENLDQTYLIFKRKIKGSSFDCCVAFMLDEAKVTSGKKLPIYCYFPTREFADLGLILHAPFILIDNRQGIKRGNDWNEKLLEELASLTADSLPICKNMGYIDDDFFKTLPINGQFYDNNPFYAVLFKKVLDKLLIEPLLPTKEKHYAITGSAYLANAENILSLFSSAQLTELLQVKDANWVFPTLAGSRRNRSELGNYVYNYLKIKELDIRFIADKLHQNFLEKQSEKWLLGLYGMFAGTTYIWENLKKKPIIRLENGTHIIPYNSANELQVFLPSTVQSEYPTVKASLLEDSSVLRLLHGLGLAPLGLLSEIEHKILPLYERGDALTDQQRLNHIEKFFQYFLKCPQAKMFSYLEKLRGHSFLVAKCNGERTVKKASEVYLSSDDLKLYFEGYKNDLYWLDEFFYEELFNKYERKEIISFLLELGLENVPRQKTYKVPEDRWSHYVKNVLEQRTITYQNYIKDYFLQGLRNALSIITFEKSLFIWDFLRLLLETNKLETEGDHCYYYYYNTKHQYFDPLFVKHLRRAMWLYDNEKNNLKPTEITTDDLNAAYKQSEKLITLLRIKTKVKPWEEDWSEAKKRKMYETFQKAKDFDAEDFEELKRIKKRRAIIKQQEDKPQRKTDDVIFQNSELKGVLESFNSIKDSVSKLGEEKEVLHFKENVAQIISAAEKQIVEIQEGELARKQLFLNLMTIQDFSSELAHVIKTSLFNVMNRAKFIKKEFPNPELEKIFKIHVDDIYQEMHNLEKAVDFILSYATFDENLEEFDIKELIETLLNYKAKDILVENNVNWEVEFVDSLVVTYNRKAFEDIIENLLTNSVKALKEVDNKQIRCSGGIEQDRFVIYFSDNGCGIEAGFEEKIFDIYETTTEDQGGSGIGLFTVKTRLKSLNGTIQVVESEFKPLGTTFRIELPFKNEAND